MTLLTDLLKLYWIWLIRLVLSYIVLIAKYQYYICECFLTTTRVELSFLLGLFDILVSKNLSLSTPTFLLFS